MYVERVESGKKTRAFVDHSGQPVQQGIDIKEERNLFSIGADLFDYRISSDEFEVVRLPRQKGELPRSEATFDLSDIENRMVLGVTSFSDRAIIRIGNNILEFIPSSEEKDDLPSANLPQTLQLEKITGEDEMEMLAVDGNGETLVDYNRAGVPLMELVTEPVVHSAEEAVAFARELQRILRYLGASEANMEQGQMRIEANISVSKDPKVFGTKCEVKNINSFASVFGAINYEVARHIELIEKGEKVIQETRGWDEG